MNSYILPAILALSSACEHELNVVETYWENIFARAHLEESFVALRGPALAAREGEYSELLEEYFPGVIGVAETARLRRDCSAL